MKQGVVELAGEVIKRATRERPADAVLREALKSRRDLAPGEAAQISHAVFAYYRWLGWLEKSNSLAEQIGRASQLAKAFAQRPDSVPDSELVQRAVPDWLHHEMAVTPQFMRALQAEPKLWLRARPGQGGLLAKALGDCRILGPDPLQDTLDYGGTKDLFRTAEFHAGQFELQDLASQAVGLVCDPQPGETWWDACAGEGGKLLHLSDLMQNKGLIWASDRAMWRLQKLKRRAARARVFNYRVAPWDGGAKLPTRTRFDGVLVDAPCSGIGTWQRNPHGRWTTTPGDLRELAEVQIQLLTHASAKLMPGGRLIYSVCSLARSETTEVVKRLEAKCPELKPCPIRNPLEPELFPAAEVYLRPEKHGSNGMFIAQWLHTQSKVVG